MTELSDGQITTRTATRVACWLRCCATLLARSFARLLRPARSAAALRRCGRASAHRAPGLRFAQSRIPPTGFGLVAFAASVADPVCAADGLVAERAGRSNSVHVLLHIGLRGHLSSRAAMAYARPSAVAAAVLCAESGPAVHADDRHDRTAFSCGDDLGSTLLIAECLSAAGKGEMRTRCAVACLALDWCWWQRSSHAMTDGSLRPSPGLVAGAIVSTGRLRANTERRAGAFVLFTVMVAVAPVLWLTYNAKQFHDPLDFIRGPYSAKAIEIANDHSGSAALSGLAQHESGRLVSIQGCRAGCRAAALCKYASVLRRSQAPSPLCAMGQKMWLRRCCCFGCLCRSTHIPSPMVRCRSSSRFGGRYSFYNTRYGMELLPVFALMLAFLLDAFISLYFGCKTWLLAAAFAADRHQQPTHCYAPLLWFCRKRSPIRGPVFPLSRRWRARSIPWRWCGRGRS